jgi:tetratricopeptide (TPR) repeat protein
MKKHLYVSIKLWKLKADVACVWYAKGLTLYDLEKKDDAIKCFDKALELDKEYIEAYLFKGFVLGFQKNTKKAYKWYDKILEIDPSSSACYFCKGFTSRRGR